MSPQVLPASTVNDEAKKADARHGVLIKSAQKIETELTGFKGVQKEQADSISKIESRLTGLGFWTKAAAITSTVAVFLGLFVLVGVVAFRPKVAATPPPPPPDSRIDGLAEGLAKVATKGDVEKLAKVPTSPGVTPEQVTAIGKKLDDALAEIRSQAAKPVAVAMPDAWKASLDKVVQEALKAAEAKAKVAAPPAPPPPANLDVWVVITHGNALNASDYAPSLLDALKSGPRGPGAAVRVGLATAATRQLTVRLGATEPSIDKIDFSKDSKDESEMLAQLGAATSALFDPSRPRRRTVLVASASCEPALPDDGDWRGLTDVHVVLIAKREVVAVDAQRLAGWHRFAEGRGGTVTLVGPGDNAKQSDSLKVALLRIIRMTP